MFKFNAYDMSKSNAKCTYKLDSKHLKLGQGECLIFRFKDNLRSIMVLMVEYYLI